MPFAEREQFHDFARKIFVRMILFGFAPDQARRASPGLCPHRAAVAASCRWPAGGTIHSAATCNTDRAPSPRWSRNGRARTKPFSPETAAGRGPCAATTSRAVPSCGAGKAAVAPAAPSSFPPARRSGWLHGIAQSLPGSVSPSRDPWRRVGNFFVIQQLRNRLVRAKVGEPLYFRRRPAESGAV